MGQNDGNSDFALRLTQTLCDSKQNLCLSPYSIRMAFSMALNGARGNTLRQMTKVLGYDSDSIDRINQANADVMKKISQDLSEQEMISANSVWIMRGITLNTDYKNRLDAIYKPTIQAVDFGSAMALKMINDWVSQNTKGRIRNLFEQLPRATVIALINAVVFTADWYKPFDPKMNVKAPWLGSRKKTVTYMTRTEDTQFTQNKNYTVVRLPYYPSKVNSSLEKGLGGQTKSFVDMRMPLYHTLAMYLFLPEPHVTPAQLLKELSAGSLSDVLSQVHLSHCKLLIPKFRIETKTELKKVLANMGMALPFGGGADFSQMTSSKSGLYISEALQKCCIDVNEKGTSAAAATGIILLGVSQNPPVFAFNRPFVFLIRHDPTGEILFSGVVNDPQ